MRCPKCHKEVRTSERYCKYCGYDLKRRVKTQERKPTQLPLLIIILTVIVAMIAGMLTLRTGNSNDRHLIGPLKNDQVAQVLYTYETIEDFQIGITNAESFITPILAYTQKLEETYQMSLTPSYRFIVAANNNVDIRLTYQGEIDAQTTFTLERHYDRDDFDELTVKVKKSGCTTFEELRQEEHQELLEKILGAAHYEKLLKKFDQKEASFASDHEKISHYGMGVYLDQGSSFVIHRHGDRYSSTVTYHPSGDGKLRV